MAVNSEARVMWQAVELFTAVQGAIEQRMKKAVIIVRDQVKVLSNRPNPTGQNPSAPGEPPKRVTGRFFKSVTTAVIKDGDSIIGLVGTDVPYQPRLEFGFVGTDSLGRVYHQEPRPAFRPALAIAMPKIQQIFTGSGGGA